EARLAREEAKVSDLLVSAQASGEKITGKEFQIVAKANAKSTRLFGAITEADVAEAIHKETGVEVDKRRISLVDPIKITGNYSLTIRIHPEVTVPFTVDVVTPETLEAREKVRLVAEEKAAKEAAKIAADEAAKAPAEAPAATE
ncbi:MAG: 50S ribosomal protein L9, partial [Chthonomonadaceae bacterium]|nr:50S ribosomal protein L9 [Chthonomonadaceae bacterium]